jgi:hypothetical protein
MRDCFAMTLDQLKVPPFVTYIFPNGQARLVGP